jgi:hypothetical protein
MVGVIQAILNGRRDIEEDGLESPKNQTVRGKAALALGRYLLDDKTPPP